MHSDMGDLIMG